MPTTDREELVAFQSIAGVIASDVAAVEARFARELASEVPAAAQLLKYVSRFRGKMLRPVLLLLTARALGRVTDEHTVLATVVEMVHMASLVHDDVLDEAELRRKGATINHLKGNEAAVMLGDLLFSHAFYLCSSLDSQHASRVIGRATKYLCEGELQQIAHRNNFDLDEEIYYEIISRKTAALVAVCSELGAEFAGGTTAQVAAMKRFGQCVGTAFQIQDDILDLTGDAADVGKTLGLDIEKGKLTLPLIHFLRTAPAAHRELLRSLLRSGEADRTDRIRNLILPSGSLDYARESAEKLITEARACLDVLPESEARDSLDAAARFVTQRCA